MASDEIEIAFKKYKDGIEGMDDIEIAMSKDDFTAGYTQGRTDAEGKGIELAYTQGRADAWRWIPVSERQPEKSGKYLVSAFDGDQGSSLDYYADYKGWNINWLTSSREHEMFPTHWMELPPAPIKLPGGEND